MRYIKEHKFWGKNNREFLQWIKDKSNQYWIVIDTETTGLRSDDYDVQLTQISCVVFKYNYNQNSFEEIDSFDKKIKLNDKSLSYLKSGKRIKKVLSFNHYGKRGLKYFNEEDVLSDFSQFISQYPDSLFIIQNASFDMRFLSIRSDFKFKNEVLDTKQVLQLFYLPTLLKLAEDKDEYKKLIDKIGRSDRDNGLISSSMGKIGPALGIDMTGYHDALTDCRLATEMLKRIIDFLKKHQDLDISKYQYERIKFIK